MTLSVALCSFNGAAHLPQQLASIASQERLPDELVACDDGSRDASYEMLQEFARGAPFMVRAAANPTRLGCTSNFAQAIARCSGGIIALCDQDDVWLPHKLRRLVDRLEARPEAAFAFSDATLVDSSLRPLGYSLWSAIGFSDRGREMMTRGDGVAWLVRRYAATGATMAFRAAYRDLILPIPEVWPHDAWIALLLSAVATCVAVDEPLILYRQHAAQQIGERRRSLYEQYRRARLQHAGYFERVRNMYAAARDRLSSAGASGYSVDARALRLLDEKLAHCEARVAMRHDGRRLRRVLGECAHGRYGRYSLGWKSVAQDLLL